MAIFPFFKSKAVSFFSAKEQEMIQAAIADAEKRTSGEVRVYVESHCEYVNALDRAAELFHHLKMNETAQKNGVLVYIAMKDRQLAIYGDEAIHNKAGQDFWNAEVKKMLTSFNKSNYAEGITQIVKEIGEVLSDYFPYNEAIDKNELPDEIVFGK